MCPKPFIYEHILEVAYVNRGPFCRDQESHYPISPPDQAMFQTVSTDPLCKEEYTK